MEQNLESLFTEKHSDIGIVRKKKKKKTKFKENGSNKLFYTKRGGDDMVKKV